MPIHRHPPEDLAKALLSRCGLPVVDLRARHFEHFFGCGARDRPEGVVGVELHGECALLRSLAVAEAARGAGCGRKLVLAAENHARINGVRRLYLLTDTAEAFFHRLGYRSADRHSAPASIRASREFTELCPSSAAFMVKDLGGDRS